MNTYRNTYTQGELLVAPTQQTVEPPLSVPNRHTDRDGKGLLSVRAPSRTLMMHARELLGNTLLLKTGSQEACLQVQWKQQKTQHRICLNAIFYSSMIARYKLKDSGKACFQKTFDHAISLLGYNDHETYESKLSDNCTAFCRNRVFNRYYNASTASETTDIQRGIGLKPKVHHILHCVKFTAFFILKQWRKFLLSLKNLCFFIPTQVSFLNKIRKNDQTSSALLIYKLGFELDLLAIFQPVSTKNNKITNI